MIKITVYFLVLVTLLAFNIFLPKIADGSPNLLFLLVLLFAFSSAKNEASEAFIWLAFFAGLLLDIFSATFFGTYMLAFLLSAFAVNYIARSLLIAEKNIYYLAALIVVADLFMVGLVYLFNSLAMRLDSGVLPLPAQYLQRKVWIDLLLNLLFAGPVYFVTVLIERMVQYYHKKLRQYE